jgi:hypothetical protein
MRIVCGERQKKTKWIESCLEHVSDKNDAAQWLSYYLGKIYEGSFMLALEALGIPVILIIPNRESSRSIFSCILGNVFLSWIAHSMLS